ncbi:FHA domain-containing protein, partial [Streptomyces lavendulae]|uniref:FHA domain-containing protein n=1 Tax=Streptomyces lavendulae TaxID=1914 RepID=UPI0036D14796
MPRRSPAGRTHRALRSAQKGPLTAMQIRLTVLGPRSGHQAATAAAGCDVLVTAPVGTVLAAVASGLAATVGGPDTGGTVVLYAGARRLDLQRAVLGEPPLVDGAVLTLHTPAPEGDAPADDGHPAPQLHVVAGPDAGGVHLLHPGAVRIGRSADADVPLDDPDVSRLHCAVTVRADGRVTVADLGSTNGTTLDGAPVGAGTVPLPPGALLRVGESTLRLASGSGDARSADARPLTVVPDLEGHLSLPAPAPSGAAEPTAAAPSAAGPDPALGLRPGTPRPGTPGAAHPATARPASPDAPGTGTEPGRHSGAPLPAAPGSEERPAAPGAARRRGLGAWARRWVRGEEP